MFSFFSKKKLLLAFEYALIFSEVANQMKKEITPELSKKAEEMILSEFKSKKPEQLAVEMGQNIMSIFELDLSK